MLAVLIRILKEFISRVSWFHLNCLLNIQNNISAAFELASTNHYTLCTRIYFLNKDSFHEEIKQLSLILVFFIPADPRKIT